MSVKNDVRIPRPKKATKDETDFSKVGGLSHHISTLKDLIIFPLLHGDVYTHFKIKAPRGVLFYGPPGTGKTLVAGALANEMNKDGSSKVSFFQRKGADVLDKWVGESEKKLRALFEKAAKNRPAVIFFDELDGLAPVRSQKNDHVHCSVVATLLAMMDGLDSMPGVIVIGATNRLDSVDPALRRPGRFDKELYFPLPATDARKEILQVHTHSWKHKPSSKFLTHLAEITTGFCGSDLQALCADAVLCCVKRLYPNIQKSLTCGRTNINLECVKVEECDFLNARQSMVSSSLKLGSKRRKLATTIRPLLERQLNKVMSHISLVWPHFVHKGYKYLIGSERYAGRVIIFGSNRQGVNTHLLPAILQCLEHLPAYLLDIPTIFDNNMSTVTSNLPSILVLSRVDDWWHLIENSAQMSLAAALEDIHAGLPILVVATCKTEVPEELQDFFYNNQSVVINIDDPDQEEKAKFFAPIFFSEKHQSLNRTLVYLRNVSPDSETCVTPSSSVVLGRRSNRRSKHARMRAGGGKRYELVFRLRAGGKIQHKHSSHRRNSCAKRRSHVKFRRSPTPASKDDETGSFCTTCCNLEKKKYFNLVLSELIDHRARISNISNSVLCDKQIKSEPKSETSLLRCNGILNLDGDTSDVDKARIYNLWKRTYQITSKGMPVSELELLYDAIATCINMYSYNFKSLCERLEHILDKFENSDDPCN